ncbi:putative alpha-galactosidase [Colletotrichum sublineola]|uniref:Putative alpha-galactosidase n=1 Tax=Colletotrichum sublineola TaxID=1173701 RepID=A0A066XSY4_COLSU|nr:putative alpha-galactosidase [Colletotrichum sublineola]
MHCLYGPPTKHPASTIPYPNGSNLSSAAEKESPQNGRDSQNDLQVTQSSGDISSMRSALPARLPVLVRNAWNEYGCDVTEVVFLAAAKHMMGLRPAGSSKPWTRSTRWGSRSASIVRTVSLNRLSSMGRLPAAAMRVPWAARRWTLLRLRNGIDYEFFTVGVAVHPCTITHPFNSLHSLASGSLIPPVFTYLSPMAWFDDWKCVPELRLGGPPPDENQDNGQPLNSKPGKPTHVEAWVNGTSYDWRMSRSRTGAVDGQRYFVHGMRTGEGVGVFEDEYTVELAGHDTALRANEVGCVERPARK